jgi:teichuronic acid biosynthesis glycosyltransferase TuaC
MVREKFRDGMDICIITQHYPSINDSTYAFVETLVCALVDLGHRCTVVAPQSRLSAIKNKRVIRNSIETRKTQEGNEYTVYSPGVPSLYRIPVLRNSLMKYESKKYFHAVKQAISSIEPQPEILYGHFVNPAGLLAAQLGRLFGIPSFVALGESDLKARVKEYGIDKTRESLRHLSGAVAVSSQIKEDVLSLQILPEIPVAVIPNAIDDKLFSPRSIDERNRMRRKLDIDAEDFVVAFVGYFNERKGPHRVVEAIEGLEGVKGLFFGIGPNRPVGKQVAFCGTVDHQQLPDYLACADVFVLPTLAEGCCNAIIEAMACGLPVISSDLPFNDDILHADNAIRIPPTDIKALRESIQLLINDEIKRKSMGQKSLEHAKKLTIMRRATAISDILESQRKHRL